VPALHVQSPECKALVPPKKKKKKEKEKKMHILSRLEIHYLPISTHSFIQQIFICTENAIMNEKKSLFSRSLNYSKKDILVS
jgi:hypothetical protein